MFSVRFEDALSFAARLHRNQRRKTSGVPYVAHLLGVAALVIEDHGTEDEAIAALLHDALEDQSRSYPGGYTRLAADIAARYGPEVLRLVEACTEKGYPNEEQFSDRKESWRAHKRGYIAQIVGTDASSLRISCADSLHNVRSLVKDYRKMGDQIWQRFLTRSAQDQLWAYREAARAYAAAGVGSLADELLRAVEELELEVNRP